MKNLFVLVILLCTLSVSAQKIDGFYTGVLHNDSAKMIQQYELAIAMYKGKITGYSYVTFIVKDTFYYGIRKVKGEIVGDSIVVEDDKFISNNFPESPAKKVGRTITIPLNGQDSLITMNGSWKTNQTKKYYSVPGTIELTKSTDSLHSPLINHLKELGIIQNNYVAANTTATVKLDKDEEKKKTSTNIVVTETKKKEKEEKKKVKTEVKAAESETKTAVVKTEKEKTPVETPVPVKLPFDQRKSAAPQMVDASTDSLTLAFYDNGVVDGDSISVYMNGQLIVPPTKLTTTATKKTIAIPSSGEVQLLLVAENLGSIPPNTGLLTIRDGEKIYQVNFSADMQTNAPVVIRRKKN